MRISGRGPLGLKADKPTSAEVLEGRLHMALVAQLPCVICGARPVEVHHCISGRYGQRRASDMETIPLCASCHRTGPDAIHRSKHAWEAKHGPDTDYLSVVAEMLSGS